MRWRAARRSARGERSPPVDLGTGLFVCPSKEPLGDAVGVLLFVVEGCLCDASAQHARFGVAGGVGVAGGSQSAVMPVAADPQSML